ncbi:hypothetical protein WJX73_005327 [Symbiochloris irregularis]|uniref:Uncharacterized protein n=1 Tax=Symbiochloris irregularis TaxID=706552 RepID=A0AAW1P5B3_9CHLO
MLPPRSHTTAGTPSLTAPELQDLKGVRDEVRKLLFSPRGDSLAVITETHVTVFALLDGNRLWERGLDQIIGEDKELSALDTAVLLSWHFGLNQLTGCGSRKGGELTFIFTVLSAQTGSPLKSSVIQPGNADGLAGRWSFIICDEPVFKPFHEPVFSSDGTMVTQYIFESKYGPSEERLLVLNIATTAL